MISIQWLTLPYENLFLKYSSFKDELWDLRVMPGFLYVRYRCQIVSCDSRKYAKLSLISEYLQTGHDLLLQLPTRRTTQHSRQHQISEGSLGPVVPILFIRYIRGIADIKFCSKLYWSEDINISPEYYINLQKSISITVVIEILHLIFSSKNYKN